MSDSIKTFQNESFEKRIENITSVLSSDPKEQQSLKSQMLSNPESFVASCQEMIDELAIIEKSNLRFAGAEYGIAFKERKFKMWDDIFKNTSEYFFAKDNIVPNSDKKFSRFAIRFDLTNGITAWNGEQHNNDSKILYVCEPNFQDTLNFPNSFVLSSDEPPVNVLKEVNPKELFDFYVKQGLILNEYGIPITDKNIFSSILTEDALFFWKFYPIAWLGGLYAEVRMWLARRGKA